MIEWGERRTKAFRILQVTPVYVPSVGGIEDFVRGISASVVEAGLGCDIAEVAPFNREWRVDRVDSCNVFRIPLYGGRVFGAAPDLRRLRGAYDLVHIHDPQVAALTINSLVVFYDLPRVLSTLGGFFHTKQYAAGKRLHKAVSAPILLRSYASVLASSDADQERFSRLCRHVELVPCGVNTLKFENLERDVTAGFHEWIFWGRFSHNKRIDLLIRYTSEARKMGFPVRTTICGADFDGQINMLSSLIEELELQDNVQIILSPSDERLVRCVARAQVFITASEYEGFGLSIVEAMAAGLPVICRDVAPLNGFVKNNVNGGYLSFDMSGADRGRLARFLSASQGDYMRLSVSSRERAAQYAWKHAAKKFIEVYERLLRPRGGAQSNVGAI
jgi:alpha-1,3-mannosyltransferase